MNFRGGADRVGLKGSDVHLLIDNKLMFIIMIGAVQTLPISNMALK